MQTALISMKSTQLKVSRNWNSMMNSITLTGKNGLFTPPSYSHVYKLKSVQQSNDKGTWFGWTIDKGWSGIRYKIYTRPLKVLLRVFQKETSKQSIVKRERLEI